MINRLCDMLTFSVQVLLFVLWYCHKRGREVRLEREHTEGRVEELPDDLALPAPESTTGGPGTPTIVEPPRTNRTD